MDENIPPFRQCLYCASDYPNTKEFFKGFRCRKCVARKAQESRRDYLGQGLCAICGKSPLVLNRNACVECLAIQNERVKAMKLKAATAGLCVTCRKRPLVTKALCEVCRKKTIERNRKTTLANTENRQCGDCKGPRDSKKQLCEPCSKVRRQQSKARCRTLRSRVLDVFGRICNCCGESEERFLTLDHVNNDGFDERSKRKTDQIYNRSLLPEHRNEYQILCWNCNMGKAYNKGVCPHVDGRTGYLKLCS